MYIFVLSISNQSVIKRSGRSASFKRFYLKFVLCYNVYLRMLLADGLQFVKYIMNVFHIFL